VEPTVCERRCGTENANGDASSARFAADSVKRLVFDRLHLLLCAARQDTEPRDVTAAARPRCGMYVK
jgi:hypothetical protein